MLSYDRNLSGFSEHISDIKLLSSSGCYHTSFDWRRLMLSLIGCEEEPEDSLSPTIFTIVGSWCFWYRYAQYFLDIMPQNHLVDSKRWKLKYMLVVKPLMKIVKQWYPTSMMEKNSGKDGRFNKILKMDSVNDCHQLKTRPEIDKDKFKRCTHG